MIIAIDGPAGVGKSTIALRLARELGWININSGNFYRAITNEVVKTGLDPANEEAVLELAEGLRFSIREYRLHANDVDVEDWLHTDEVDAWAAQVSSIPSIRNIVNRNFWTIASSQDVVIEGRDITTVVFPKANLKVFLDASVEIRAKRRLGLGGTEKSLEELERSIVLRDEIDRNKPEGALQLAEDARYIDTSHLTLEEVYAKVYLMASVLTDG